MSLILIWLKAWVIACLSEILPLSVIGSAFLLIPNSLDIHAFHSLSEGINSLIIRFTEWIYTSLFLIAVVYFDTS